MRRRGEQYAVFVDRALVLSGGHPKMLARLVPWLYEGAVVTQSAVSGAGGHEGVLQPATLPEQGHMEPREIWGVVQAGMAILPENVVHAALRGTRLPASVAEFEECLSSPLMLSRPSTFLPFVPIVSSMALIALPAEGAVARALCNLASVKNITRGEDFEAFVFHWLNACCLLASDDEVLAVKLFVDLYDGASNDMVEHLHVARLDVITPLYRDKEAFTAALPSLQKSFTFNDSAPAGPADAYGYDEANGLRGRCIMPTSSVTRGFDLLAGVASTPLGSRGHLLAIQCKAHKLDTSIVGGDGSTLTNAHVEHTVRGCVKSLKWFFEHGWTVSLLILSAFADCSVNLGATEFTWTGLAAHEHEWACHLLQRTAVFPRGALRGMFRPTVAFMLELAQGFIPRPVSTEEAVPRHGGSSASNV